jgi:hypothetical protein
MARLEYIEPWEYMGTSGYVGRFGCGANGALDHATGAWDMDACRDVELGLCIMDMAISDAIDETTGAM